MMKNKIYVKDCNFGKGVFASINITKGEEIINFKGPIINFQQAIDKNKENGNALQIKKDLYIDIIPVGLYFNHSCEPNAGIKRDIKLVAIKKINKDEQIFYDYSTTMSEDYWTMNCKCNVKNCRKIIKDFKYLPQVLKNKYIELGIVQKFIVDEYKI